MKEIKNVILCGCGAVGSVYADILSKTQNINFKVLLDEQRLSRYQANPVLFNGLPLNVSYITPDYDSLKADLVLIATKISGLDEALIELEKFVTSETVILPLLNGVMSEEIVAKKYGRQSVLYSYFIGHSSVRIGNSITHDGVNTIVFGSDCPADVDNVKRVKEFFDYAGVNYLIPDDIRHSLWAKFMLNVSANPTTALFHMNFGEMLSNKPFMDLAVKIMREVQQVAKFEGVRNTETLVDETLVALTKMIPDGKTSMLQDVEAGRKTENDIFAQTVVDLGNRHGISTPYCKMLCELFEVIDYNK